jgi:two-component system response regulator YesN
MIRVILADDDYLVREILRSSVNWEDLGMELAASAEDGGEALEYCLNLRPDILLADIRMPVLNGLEVAFRLLENGLRTRVIFVSGIQDFDYARTALTVQAAAYILKPIQLNEVTAALKKVRDSIEIESHREMVLLRMQEKLNENIPLIRDMFLHDLVLGTSDPVEELEEKLDYLKLPFRRNDEIIVAVAEIDDYRELIREKSEKETHLLIFTIKGFIDQVLENYQAGACFMPREGEYILLLKNKYSEKHKISLIFENILEMLEKFGGLSISMGVGNCASRLNSVNSSCHEALSALKNKFFTGRGSIIHFSDVVETQAVNKTAGDENNTRLLYLRKALIEQIRMGNSRNITGMLDEFYSFTNNLRDRTREYICGQFLELVIAAYQEFCKTEGEVKEIFVYYVKSMQAILQAETVAEIQTQAGSMILAATCYFDLKYNRRNQKSVSRIKDYIIENRGRNISLTNIANEANMSPNYMCAVFKRETGQTLNEFIIQDKMSCAMELLKNSRMKILEIAEHLGYDSPHYFSYSFKHYTGLSPQQYRTKQEKP